MAAVTTKAEALSELRQAVDSEAQGTTISLLLEIALTYTNPGWEKDPKWAERIKQVGPIQAAKGLLRANSA